MSNIPRVYAGFNRLKIEISAFDVPNSLTIKPKYPNNGLNEIVMQSTNLGNSIEYDIRGVVKNLFKKGITSVNSYVKVDYSLRSDIEIKQGRGAFETVTVLNASVPYPNRMGDELLILNAVYGINRITKYKGYPLELAYLNKREEKVSFSLQRTNGSSVSGGETNEIHFLIVIPDSVSHVGIYGYQDKSNPNVSYSYDVIENSRIYTAPKGVNFVDVFVVGGGGGGGGGAYREGSSGNGGNGGQALLVRDVPVGSHVNVIIGEGGAGIYGGADGSSYPGIDKYPETPGGDTKFGDITAAGGFSGRITFYPNKPQPGHAQGGLMQFNPSESRPGEDGTICPFPSSSFVGKKFGAAGGSGAAGGTDAGGSGGETGGGTGGATAYFLEQRNGRDGTFYGGGGGGGAFDRGTKGKGGAGYKGVVIVRYANPTPTFEVEIAEGCVPDHPFYIRWINRIGGYDYYMFDKGHELKRIGKTKGYIDRYSFAGDTDTRKVYNIEAEDRVKVLEENISRDEWEKLSLIPYSPKIEYYDKERESWVTISVTDASNSFFENSTRGSIEIEFKLEEVNIQL